MRDASASRLLEWFRQVARPFPWREPFPRDPYRTLVAEVMLQQTQAVRATQAWQRFILAFPTLADVAAASEDAVLLPFSGLGYYRRARLLHAACRAVAERGAWPGTASELARLPGVGPYTAAALAAFCFQGTDPPVDGNLVRIAARVLAVAEPAHSPAARRAAAGFARSLHARVSTPAIWEALMELGAGICRPRAPRCPACPLAPACRAYTLGTPTAFPLANPARPVEATVWVALWVTQPTGAVLLRRVADGSLLAGLWLPPIQPLVHPTEDPREGALQLARALGLGGRLAPLPPVRHSITHHRITILPFCLRQEAPVAAEACDDRRWAVPAVPTVPTSSLLAKLARAAEAVPLRGSRPRRRRCSGG